MREEFGPLSPYCPHKKPKKDARSYTATSLWTVWVDFVKWNNANPIEAIKKVVQRGLVVEYTIPKYRPYVKSEFLRFAGIHRNTWEKWKKSRPELLHVIEDIEDMIIEQRLIGGYTNQFNTTITSQDLGLTTKVDMNPPEEKGFEDYLEKRKANDEAKRAYKSRQKQKKTMK